jgi:tetratricopeptide (TPR) repeat protein
VITSNPDDAKNYLDRGIAYELKGQYDRALEDFNKALALDPHLPDAYSKRGVVYAKMRKPERAIEDCNKAISLDPYIRILYMNPSSVYVAQTRMTNP